jgi:hypothetical protein
MATIADESVCAGLARNLALEQLMNLPEAEKEHCQYISGEPDSDKQISRTLSPLAE